MEATLSITLEVEDAETLADIITILETMLPYIADNMVVVSSIEDGPLRLSM